MSLKYYDIPVTHVKAGDRIMVSGLWRIVCRIETSVTGDITLFFDHGDYQTSITYQPSTLITVMA